MAQGKKENSRQKKRLIYRDYDLDRGEGMYQQVLRYIYIIDFDIRMEPEGKG